jgi:hypothetical protein
LPFACARITIDDGPVRAVDPPTDVVATDLPGAAPLKHHITATAPDGTIADGDVTEEQGIARPLGDGFAFTAPPGARDDTRSVTPPPASQPKSRPAGKVQNGFTKLR